MPGDSLMLLAVKKGPFSNIQSREDQAVSDEEFVFL